MFKKLLLFVFVLSILIPLSGSRNDSVSALSGSDFNAGRIIDDSKFFTNTPSMSINEIQAFLNAKVPVCDTNGTVMYNSTQTRAQWAAANGKPQPPYTCLKSFTDSTIGWPAEAGLCKEITGRSGNAAQMIYWVSEACGINPQVLIVLLQKEQSLVTDDWPWPRQYQFATGFCVYDTGPPPPSCTGTEGFFGQLYYASRQFKKYGRNPGSYSYRSGVNNNILWHPNTSCGSSTVYIENQATAGLYNYTPYRPNQAALNNLYGSGDGCSSYGNRNFWRMFNDWFGSTLGPPDYSCKFSSNVSGAGTGARLMTHQYASVDRLALILPNNTGSACVEAHISGVNFQNWLINVPTPMGATNPSSGMFVSSKSVIDGQKALNYMLYNGAANRVELHRMSPNYQKFPGYYDIQTDLTGITSAAGTFVAGDFFGQGYDQMVLVLYNGAGGNMEVHMFNPSMTKAIGHYDLISNFGGVTKDTGVFVSGDFFGRGYDQLAYITYGDTGVHVLDIRTGKVVRMYEQNTNLKGTSPATGTFIAGDFLGRGYDQLLYVIYNGTNNRVETHMFNRALNNAIGFQDLITNISGFDPNN